MKFKSIRVFEVKKGTKVTLQLRLDTEEMGQIHIGDIVLNDTIADPDTRTKLLEEVRKRLHAKGGDTEAS